jgi:NAD-dependent dihydropyrimidine dehydrogenase PreA subunit
VQIDKDLCTGCLNCQDFCPVDAIEIIDDIATIDPEICVECGTCFRWAECPSDAILRPELQWPRSIRQWFSDPTTTIPGLQTLGAGRGVPEVKNNDRTGYYKGEATGFIIELGRPGVSAAFKDIQKLLTIMSGAGFCLTKRSPLTPFIVDADKAELQAEILNERVLSCSLEYKTTLQKIPDFIHALKQAEKQVDTVFTVGLLSIINSDFTIPTVNALEKLGVRYQPNAKINIGLGHPLASKY